MHASMHDFHYVYFDAYVYFVSAYMFECVCFSWHVSFCMFQFLCFSLVCTFQAVCFSVYSFMCNFSVYDSVCTLAYILSVLAYLFVCVLAYIVVYMLAYIFCVYVAVSLIQPFLVLQVYLFKDQDFSLELG